ncbi:BrnA antitoxin family protein [Comamonas sp. J-3]|jgi:uncharacterized protein (DUF4415 family)|uniref:BrnA antitoxin family protein n=1 Tax=Comamonas trifloxystrobinivorans TaxID=3350256 RepID=UPI0037299538
MPNNTKDPEILAFEAALLRSVDQAINGEYAAIHTPEQIAARKRGRPAGSTKEEHKISTTIRLDADVLEALKATGKGWQTRLNDLIRADIQAGRLKALA